jgi:hypothetical protein
MKSIAVTLAAVACLWMGASIVRAEEKTLTGKISDSLCGKSHKEMAEKQGSKISDRDCVIACLNYSTENSPKLVFVGQDAKIYQIANQKFAGLVRHVGELMAVTGDVNAATITVTKLEAVPAKSK